MGSINNIPALAQIMAWRRPGDKPLSEPMMVRLLTHLCVTRPQWVNNTPTWGFIMAAPGGCQAIIWTHDVIGYRCITVTHSGFNGLPQQKPQLSKSSCIFVRVWEKRTITILLTALNIDSVIQNMWINKSFSISNSMHPQEIYLDTTQDIVTFIKPLAWFTCTTLLFYHPAIKAPVKRE